MSGVQLDHLVVVAATLEAGSAWCESTFGVVPEPGGRHALMGTHNRLLALGGPNVDRAYLEIIALDPQAEPPGRPRWFGMDGPAPEPPRLVHWAARSRVLDMHRWGLINRGIDPGPSRALQRDALRWRLTVRDDGRLLAGGALPTLIEWQGTHPADTLPPRGVQLLSLTLRGLDGPVQRVLQPRPPVTVTHGPGPALEARFDTPRGPVTLTSEAVSDD